MPYNTEIPKINSSVENLPDRVVDYDVGIIIDNIRTIYTYNPGMIEKKYNETMVKEVMV